MSQAFTRESDSEGDDRPVPPSASPGGVRNYITAAGHAALWAEWRGLMDVERPKIVEVVHWAASNGDRSENGDYLYGKKRLREIDRRIRFLTHRLECAEVVEPSVHHGSDTVFFGACVTYLHGADPQPRQVTILGIDEAQSALGQVSWVAPIARALLRAQVGDVRSLQTPGGLVELEVLAVNYPAPQG